MAQAQSIISKRLKEAAWVKYSKTYKCFVMHHTPQAIELTYTHFQGLARVDVRYLNRPRRLRPTAGLVVTGGGKRTSEPLEKVPVRPVVRLQPLEQEGKALIQISFRFNKGIL